MSTWNPLITDFALPIAVTLVTQCASVTLLQSFTRTRNYLRRVGNSFTKRRILIIGDSSTDRTLTKDTLASSNLFSDKNIVSYKTIGETENCGRFDLSIIIFNYNDNTNQNSDKELTDESTAQATLELTFDQLANKTGSRIVYCKNWMHKQEGQPNKDDALKKKIEQNTNTTIVNSSGRLCADVISLLTFIPHHR